MSAVHSIGSYVQSLEEKSINSERVEYTTLENSKPVIRFEAFLRLDEPACMASFLQDGRLNAIFSLRYPYM